MKKNKHKLVTLAALTAMATAVIHCINKFISASAQLKEMLDTSGRKTYSWRFGSISYTKKGQGKPLLLIHDVLPGASGHEWSNVEKQLSSEYTVYNVDLLGCGRSEKPGITYTNFLYVQMISDFIKNVIGEKTDVIASGFSGSFVVMACHNEKELFNKIMLVNPTGIAKLREMPGQREKLLKAFLEIPVFGTLIYHMAVSRESVSNLFIERLYFNPFHADEDVMDTYYEAAHKGGYYAKSIYASMISKFMNINLVHALKSLDNSVYIVEGEAEPNGPAIVSEYCTTNPAIETASIPASKHIPHLENPEAFLDQIGIFF